jgi:hypothetical protein
MKALADRLPGGLTDLSSRATDRAWRGHAGSTSRDVEHLLRRLPQHSRKKPAGSRSTPFDLAAPADDAQIWEKALRKLRGHLMPPPGAPRPPQKEIDSFAAWMENTLDSHASGPKAGHVPIQRLNRTEYAETIKLWWAWA